MIKQNYKNTSATLICALAKTLGCASLLIILITALSSNNTTLASNNSFIVTHGNGGDYEASRSLHKRLNLQKNNIDLFNLSTEEGFKNFISMSGEAEIMIMIGQNAINMLADKNPGIKCKKILFYSHLYSPDMINFINNSLFCKDAEITVYITESQLETLRTASFFFRKDIDVIPFPLVINSYFETEELKNLALTNSDVISNILTGNTIHLGGSYKNSLDQWVYVDDNDIEKSIKKLPLGDKKLSVLIHPRTFFDCKIDGKLFDFDKVRKRLLSLDKSIKKHHSNVTDLFLYLPSFIIDQLDSSGKFPSELNIFASPDYNAILFMINNPDLIKKGNLHTQFISVDQYNAFANIKFPVYPFLLKDNDLEQQNYLKSYKNLIENSSSSGFNNHIIDHIINRFNIPK